MMNKAINYAARATVDSFKSLIKKLPNFLAAFGIVFGATTLVQQDVEANAVTVANTLTATASDANGDTTANDTITSSDTFTLSGANGSFNASNTEIVIASLTSATANSASDVAGAGGLKVTGNLVGTKDLIITVDSASKFEFGGNATDDGTEKIEFILEGSTLTISGASAQNIDAEVDSDSGNDGVLALTGGGAKTFDAIIGGSSELATMTDIASGVATFNAAVDVKAITATGAMTFAAATGVNTLTINDTVSLNAATTNEAATDEAAVVMNQTASILNFNAGGDVIQDIIVTATTANMGTINIFDGTDDAAAGTTTLAAASLIGVSGTGVGTLNVGKTDGTKGGNLVTVNAAAIFVNDLNVTGGNHVDEDSTISLIENLTATGDITLSATGGADAVLKTLTAAVVVAGDINSASGTDGAGFTLIDADIATTLSGNVGNSVAIEKMDIAAIQVDLDGATNAIENINFSGDGELEFGDASAQTLTGTIVTATTEEGTVENGNTAGVVTITGTLGTDALRLKEIALLDNTDTTFQSAVVALDLDVDTAAADDVTTFTIGNIIGDKDTTAGALDVAGGTFVLDTAAVDGTTVFDVTETNNADGGVELRALVVQPAANFTNGTVTFIDGATTASIDAEDVAAVTVTDTVLTDFTVNATAGVADITITAAAKSATETAAALGLTKDQGTAIHQVMEAAISGDTTLMNTLNESLTGVNSGVLTTTTDLAKQAAPQSDAIGGSAVATRAMTGTVQGIVSNRMASLRSGDAYVTGMSAGNGMSAQSGFIQAFGSEGEQKNTSSSGATVFGFDTETSGLALGFDGITDSGSTLGLSASYSTTDVDGKGTGKSKNSIDSYTVSVYADKSTESGYIEGSLTYGINDNTSTRVINTASLDRAYSANYDSQQISLKVGGGIPQEVTDSAFVTPFMSVTGTNITTDAYTEKSNVANDALRLSVAQDDINSVVGSVGVKAHMVTNAGTPMISLALNNEFGDSKINSNNNYTGGGTKFKTSTEVEEVSATLGLGYSFGNDVTSLNINYEANANDDDYVNQYGSVKIVAKF